VREACCQIDVQTGEQYQLWQQIARLRDRRRLREYVATQGMVLEPAASDQLQLPPLTEPQWTISALSPRPETLARPAGTPQLERRADDSTVVAEAF
jgi:hypothetical protein